MTGAAAQRPPVPRRLRETGAWPRNLAPGAIASSSALAAASDSSSRGNPGRAVPPEGRDGRVRLPTRAVPRDLGRIAALGAADDRGEIPPGRAVRSPRNRGRRKRSARRRPGLPPKSPPQRRPPRGRFRSPTRAGPPGRRAPLGCASPTGFPGCRTRCPPRRRSQGHRPLSGRPRPRRRIGIEAGSRRCPRSTGGPRSSRPELLGDDLSRPPPDAGLGLTDRSRSQSPNPNSNSCQPSGSGTTDPSGRHRAHPLRGHEGLINSVERLADLDLG